MPKMVCFVHNCKLQRRQTRFGGLWVCPYLKDCGVKCWEGKTSFPGTQEDFDERMETHRVFDEQWRKGGHFKNRSSAYRWLAEVLGVSMKKAHIGMLRADDCRKVREKLVELIKTPQTQEDPG